MAWHSPCVFCFSITPLISSSFYCEHHLSSKPITFIDSMNVIIKESLPRGMTCQKRLILEVHHFTFSWVFHKKGKGETKLYTKPYPP